MDTNYVSARLLHLVNPVTEPSAVLESFVELIYQKLKQDKEDQLILLA
jgi:hypothetical protein